MPLAVNFVLLKTLIVGNALGTHKETHDVMDEQTRGGTHRERTGNTGGIPPETPDETPIPSVSPGLDDRPGWIGCWPRLALGYRWVLAS